MRDRKRERDQRIPTHIHTPPVSQSAYINVLSKAISQQAKTDVTKGSVGDSVACIVNLDLPSTWQWKQPRLGRGARWGEGGSSMRNHLNPETNVTWNKKKGYSCNQKAEPCGQSGDRMEWLPVVWLLCNIVCSAVSANLIEVSPVCIYLQHSLCTCSQSLHNTCQVKDHNSYCFLFCFFTTITE